MKKAIIPMAVVALMLASCEPTTKDSYKTMGYPECNFIIDNSDASAPAQVSTASYEVKFNLSKYCVDIKTSDLVINNQKVSFETDTMALRTRNVQTTIDGKTETLSLLTFSSGGSKWPGSAASDIKGTFVYSLVPTGSDILNPNFNVAYVERLDMNYMINDRYNVQTFWPANFYMGQSVATAGNDSYSTKNISYLTQIDFEKKTASVLVYNAEFAANEEKALPKVIRFEDIPVVFTHDSFSLESAAPKTTVLGKKDNKTEMVDSVGFAATDFNLTLISRDLTEAMISYKLDGKTINFRGCSILK